ncbi:MAG: ExeM/NucH family extracellular endonuclease [Vicinamibacterales bacterium]
MRRTARQSRIALLLGLVLAVLLVPRLFFQRTFAAQFTTGNIVVYRVGDGAAALSSAGTAVFLDEYTPTGTLVQSIAMPTTASGLNFPLVASGSATSEGLLTRSADGSYLLLTGYAAAPGTAGVATSTAASVLRVVGRVDGAGTVDTSTGLTGFFSGSNPRGVASSDGNSLWVTGGNGGVGYTTFGSVVAPTVVSSTVTNLRGIHIFDNQLYISTASGSAVRVGTVGTGLPTTAGNTITNLPGFPSSGGGPYGFFLADLTDVVPGVDTLYVADDGGNGLRKYSLSGGSWILNEAITGTYRGLSGVVSGTTVTLYATQSANALVGFTDTAGYNAAFSSTTSTILAAAATNTAFRGVALAPVPPPTTMPTVALSVSGNEASEGVPGSIAVTATASAPVGGDQTVELTVSGTGITVEDYTLSSSTITIVNGQTSGSVTFAVADDLLFEGSETATLAIGNPSAGIILGAPTSQPITIADNETPPPACFAADTPIGTIQGAGTTAALPGLRTVQGVVVGDFEYPGTGATASFLRGFYLQDAGDEDPTTSDAIFVFNGNNNSVSLGQVVQVTGIVADFQDQTQFNAGSSIEACGTTGTVTSVAITLPTPAPLGGVPYLERVEGMLVTFPQTLYVTEHFQLGRFGQVVMSADGRLQQPTNVVAPGAPAQARQAANNLNRIIIDDELQSQNPDPIAFGRGGNPLSAVNTLRGGDTATGMVGVLSYTWGGNAASPNAYRLRPIGALDAVVAHFQPANPRPGAPPAVGGRLQLASFNVLNYFLTLDIGTQANCGPLGFKQECRGAETVEELLRQQTKLNAALLGLDADILGLIELENTQDADGNDVNPLADIVGRLNASLGSAVYSYVDTGMVGTDTIRVGVIYKPTRVTPAGPPMLDTDPVHNRPPVAQTFVENSSGERFSVVVNHFKSKGCGGEAGLDLDLGDGQGCFNNTRMLQAQRLLAFISNAVVPTAGDTDVLVIGDLNSYAKEDPIAELEASGFTNLIAQFSGPDAYSYVFDGQWGYLDHALASASLTAQVNGAGDFHINADEPSVLDFNTNFKSAGQIASLYSPDGFRTSDHDPVLVGLTLDDTTPPETTLTGVPTNPSLTADATFTFTGTDMGGVAGFECALDASPFAACTSPTAFSGLANGEHTFDVRAVDAAGNVDLSPASHAWTVAVPLTTDLIAPVGGEKFFIGLATTVRWNVTGASSVDVLLSRNGGSTYTPIPGCAALPGSATSCAWTPSGPATLNARLRVVAHSTSGQTVSETSGRFTIAAGQPTLAVVWPNGSLNWTMGSNRIVAWLHNLGDGARVRIELSRNGGASWETLADTVSSNTLLSGSFTWKVTGPATNNARLRVTSLDTPASDVTNGAFRIVAAPIR